MFVQLASDLHLEKGKNFNGSDFIKPSSDVLVLAGDIVSMYKFEDAKRFFSSISLYFKLIIYVAGNHEFYTVPGIKELSFETLNKRLKSLEQIFDNVYVLNEELLQVDNYLFIGAPLWSYSRKNLPEYVSIHGVDTHKYNDMNRKQKAFVKESIFQAKQQELKPIVVTHYSPSKLCMTPRKLKYIHSDLYYNNMDYLFRHDLVWIYGHTGVNKHIQVNDTVLVSNQMEHNKNYKKDFVIEI